MLKKFLQLLHPKNWAILLIKGYQTIISPYLGNNCRYHPSCSNYAIEAFNKKGFIMGIILTAYRILRCNPFSAGGFDPVDKSEKYKSSF